MQAPLLKAVVLVIAAVFALVTAAADASARPKKRIKPRGEPVITRDYDGTPIIMQGFRRSRPSVDPPAQRAERPVRIPRGSSTFIPEPNPSPNAGPPARALLQPGPGIITPPPLNSFGDRVTNCIHSAPLNLGVGNNPTDRQAHIRQCAN